MARRRLRQRRHHLVESQSVRAHALEPERRIDYVFAGYPTPQGLGLIERCHVVCDDEKDGVWPTDHFGVYAELRTEPLGR